MVKYILIIYYNVIFMAEVQPFHKLYYLISDVIYSYTIRERNSVPRLLLN